MKRVAYYGVLALLTVGCASSQKKPSLDFGRDPVVLLSDEVAAQKKRVDLLSVELKEVRRELERVRNERMAATKNEIKDKGEIARKRAPLVEGPATAERPVETEGEVIADSSFEQMNDYFQGLQLIREKKYEEAISAFRRFLKNNPNHVYHDQAQYQLLRALYENGEYQQAVIAANRLVSTYPHSFRIPDALYLRMQSYRELGNLTDAESSLKELLERYPKEKVASDARAKFPAGLRSGRQAKAPTLLDKTRQ